MKTWFRMAGWIGVAAGLTAGTALGAATQPRRDALADGFRSPPDETKPWCYWYWISDNLSLDGITRDLEAMRRAGIGEALIGNIYLPDTEIGDVKVLSEPWWGMVEHAIREGGRLGVDIGFFNCPGWSQSGGPWIDSTQTMRHVAMSETRIRGGAPASAKLPVPKEPFQDVAVLAFPAPPMDDETIATRGGTIRCEPDMADADRMIDGRVDTQCAFPEGAASKTPLVIHLETGKPFTARSLTLHPASTAFAVECELQAEDAAGEFRAVRALSLDRTNLRPNVGFVPSGPVSVAFPAVTSRRFRLVLTGLQREGGLAEIELSAAPRLERAIEKQLGKMFQSPLPPPGHYLWPAQTDAKSGEFAVDPTLVRVISDRMDADGTLRWTPPPGDWVVLRMGMSPTGVSNAPASPSGVGYEVDKMSRRWAEHHFKSYIGQLLDRMPEGDRAAFKHVVADSYEMGSQNWTDGFADQFQERYGYDPLPWLPALTGRIVGSADLSDRFLWDLRRLVADLISTEYVGGLREISERHGLRLWLENYGHWGFPGEFLQYGGQAHDLGGEFWATGDLGSIELRAAASAAHIYNKPIVSAEAFTSGLRFESTPWSLKRRGDWALTEGINHWVLHVYIHQPWEDRIPGVNAWFSTEFNRHNTWYEPGIAWIDYYRRCCFMLQQGRHAADIAYFIGDDAPAMTGERIPELPRGYDFDFINAEVIERDLRVRDGRFVLPHGTSYRLLVLPDRDTMRPSVLRKIRDLVRAGGVIHGRPPLRSPSMEKYPSCDDEVRRLAAEVWGGGEIPGVRGDGAERAFGRGRVVSGPDLRATLEAIDTTPDVEDDGGLLWTHRVSAGADIYFVCNTGLAPIRAAPRFRVGAKLPELWDPVSAGMDRPAVFEASARGTRVALSVEPGGSRFVVFRDSAPADSAAATEIRLDGHPIASLVPARAEAPAATGTDSFTMAGWLRPDDDIDLPAESAAGVAIRARRNEAVHPLHGAQISGRDRPAGVGVSAGRNGIVLFEHGANHFAPVLVHTAPIDRWVHVAVVYRDGAPELYLDGGLARRGLKSDYTAHPAIGPGRGEGGGAFRGERMGWQSLDRALSPAELAALMKRGRDHAAGVDPIRLSRGADGALEAWVTSPGVYSILMGDGRRLEVRATDLSRPRDIEGAWEVRFPAGMDVPERLSMDRLAPLDQHENEAIRHFSGTAAYVKQFSLPGDAVPDAKNPAVLDLGRVESMAEVIVNGRNLGVVWKPPFLVDATDALRPGGNTIEVRVTGTWRNRLIGDKQFPDGFPGGASPPQFKPRVTADPRLAANSPLAPFGLMGPVRLIHARTVAVGGPAD